MKLDLSRILRLSVDPALPTGHFNPARSGEVEVIPPADDEFQQEQAWEGFTGEQRGLWKKSGVYSPQEATKWINAGIEDPTEVHRMRKVGLDPHNALPWVIEFQERGLNEKEVVDTIIKWYKVGWKNPGDAANWFEGGNGFFRSSPEKALAWKNAGWADVDVAAEWAAKKPWKDEPGAALEVYNQGFDLSELR